MELRVEKKNPGNSNIKKSIVQFKERRKADKNDKRKIEDQRRIMRLYIPLLQDIILYLLRKVPISQV